MRTNIILAGVGGQGILSIAQALSLAAVRRGWKVKQSEVHGMSQRGGAVQSHLRFSDGEIHSDLVPLGQADMVLSVEPLELLRYVQYLAGDGILVTNTAPFVNISNYPPIEEVLEQVARYPRHALVDGERLARAAGSPRAMNMVMLGAASHFLGLDLQEFAGPIEELFGRKGGAVVAVNQRACRFGRNAAAAYVDGVQRGADARSVRHWIETLSPDELAGDEVPAASAGTEVDGSALTGAEEHAVCQMLERVYGEGRRRLYEHEVYELVELVGAISPPRHLFVRRGDMVRAEDLRRIEGGEAVLKIVSPDVVHKTEAGGIAFVPNEWGMIHREMQRLADRHAAQGARVEGVLVEEKVERTQPGFGNELFVGIRSTREFGPIIAAGLGGIDTEYLAHKMRPGLAVAKALVLDTRAEEFFELFKKTAAYDILSGRARGHRRIVSDGELMRCFRAFIAVARRFCVDRGAEGPDLKDLEVNPFAFVRQRMIPLDGRGCLGPATRRPPPRPIEKVGKLLEPRSIAVLGVSGQRMNFGRIILTNIRRCGFPSERLWVVKEGVAEIDGVRCVPGVAALPEPVDLLVIATAARDLAGSIGEVTESGKAETVIVIPGGMGETEESRRSQGAFREQIQKSRGLPGGGPIVLGGNCLGVRSRPGRYDTFFIPPNKLNPRHEAPAMRAALISQSGAFIISRMSNLQRLDPAFAISLGNQIDLTLSDILKTVGAREDIDTIGVYAEGFNDLDGLDFVRAVDAITRGGKIVVFYKAGRTEPGRSATAGHTASIAGDYDVCDAAVAQAGAIVVDTFKEFEQLMELATCLHGKRVGGRRLGAISNAGYETVGMADSILGTRYQLTIPALSEVTAAEISRLLDAHKLGGLVNVRNPLDITPMAGDGAYGDLAGAMLAASEIDALIVCCVPLTPELLTAPEEISRPGSVATRLAALFQETDKPMIAVIDCGPPFDELVGMLRAAGMPVFPSCDQAVRSLGRYLCHRCGPAGSEERPGGHRRRSEAGAAAGS